MMGREYLFIYLFIYLGKIPTQINTIDFVTVGHASKLAVNHLRGSDI
jgi:hypothetical protein